MKKSVTGAIALLTTLLGASYLSASTDDICDVQIGIIVGVVAEHCDDNYTCSFTCQDGELTEDGVDCECIEN